MDFPKSCPSCGGMKFIKGSFINEGAVFSPEGLKVPFWRLSPRGIGLDNEAVLCLGCGLVLGKVDLDQVKKELESFGTAELKESLKANERSVKAGEAG